MDSLAWTLPPFRNQSASFSERIRIHPDKPCAARMGSEFSFLPHIYPGRIFQRRMKVGKEILGRPFRFGGEEHRGWLPAGASKPEPTPVKDVLLNIRIKATDEGFFLEWWDAGNKHVGDTWHQSLGDALAQAEFIFGIKPDEWKDVTLDDDAAGAGRGGNTGGTKESAAPPNDMHPR